MPKISGRSGAAASYNKKGKEFIWPHEDPKRIDAKRALKKKQYVEEKAKRISKTKAKKATTNRSTTKTKRK